MEIVGRHYRTEQRIRVRIEGTDIVAIDSLGSDDAGNSLPWLAPGLVDLQINGLAGREFNDFSLDVESVEALSRSLDRDGVTCYLPTATTQSFELLKHAFATIAEACENSQEVARRVGGFHLEGPYISTQDGPRGAHPLEHCRPPDWDEFQRLQNAAGGRIKILTLSPEYDGAADFIGRVAESGVVVAIGHTAATSEQIRAAVDAGARMSTHLGNGAHGQIRRHPNYIWDQLGEDRLVASLIADGHHLPASVLKSFVRAKQPERCVLVSDITGMAGMPPGYYENSSLGAVEVLDDGRLVIPGQTQLLAGASLPLTVGIRTIMDAAGLSLADAIDMASSRPAQIIGRDAVRLDVGCAADLIVFDMPEGEHVQIRKTINQGTLVFDDSASPG